MINHYNDISFSVLMTSDYYVHNQPSCLYQFVTKQLHVSVGIVSHAADHYTCNVT